MDVLIAASECVPLVKTGGLADVIGALPGALAPQGVQARVLLPGYPAVRAAAAGARDLGPAPFVDAGIAGQARLLYAETAGLALYVLDAPRLFDRGGGLYESEGREWPDNPQRFAALAQCAAGIAVEGVDGWRPAVLHVNDWQTGLAPVYAAGRVPTLITIHNIAYQGLFDAGLAPRLGLPEAAYGEGWEYHGRLGFLKAGLMAADAIATVSPGYAREIVTPAFGMGLEGVLAARRDRLHGILNGADTGVWDPAADPHIAAPFSADAPAGKAACRDALVAEFALRPPTGPLVGLVSRLTWQKGIDTLIQALPALLDRGGALAMIGSGEPGLEAALGDVARGYPGRVGVRFGYDDALSHRIFAGADSIAVPSRFEPCGLTQLYTLRYGAPPVVARTGGLGDTVIDLSPASLAVGAATGIVHAPGSAEALADAFARLAEAYADPAVWGAMQAAALRHPVGWGPSARAYAALYQRLAG
ncbi:MAG: glycogen synthase GlgA [Pseudomonadota bacterium]